MSQHGHDDARVQLPASEARALAGRAWPIFFGGLVVGLLGLVVALAGAAFADRGWARFGHAYVVSYAFFLSLSLGGLFFVLIQHLTKAGWSVMVRRPAEILAANMPTVAILFAPILLLVLLSDGRVYPWAQSIEGHHGHEAEHAVMPAHGPAEIILAANQDPGHAAGDHAEDEHHDDAAAHGASADHHAADGEIDEHMLHALEVKRPYLNTPFFVIRWAVYLTFWTFAGLWYFRQSTLQDETGDDGLTRKMEKLSPVMVLLFALTLTFAAFDLLMTLDPRWYSTMWGVYYFGGAFMATIATMILMLAGLQRAGYCQSVNTEHYHDLGKLLFAFVFFWGYIAFSQYMLIWYANIPEETFWYQLHGFTTWPGEDRVGGGDDFVSPWSIIGLVLLFGHLLIPFVALLPRAMKRSRPVLVFWAVWLLVLHWIDMWWIVMPHFSPDSLPLSFVEIGCLLGIGGLFVAGLARVAAHHALVPVKDPRLAESLGHEIV